MLDSSGNFPLIHHSGEVHRTVMRKLIYGPSLWPNLYSSSQRIGILSSPVKDIGCLHEISSINLSILMLRGRMMISTFRNISSRFRPGKLNINSRQARAISLWCLTPRNNSHFCSTSLSAGKCFCRSLSHVLIISTRPAINKYTASSNPTSEKLWCISRRTIGSWRD